MKADRLEFYRNKLRGTPVADLGRAIWAILLDATQEAEREERERIAAHYEAQPGREFFGETIADEIRAQGAA